MQIRKAKETGFCFGVKRALKILEEALQEYGEIETLGRMVHNQQMVNNLSKRGVRVVENLDCVQGNTVVIPSHGVPPQVVEELKARRLGIIDTTCPIVRKAQLTVKELSERGFGVIIFGDPDHPEVKGMLGWAGERGIATLNTEMISKFDKLPRHLGLLSQTTRDPAQFAHFANNFVNLFLPQIGELRIVNTLCDVCKRRQATAMELARKVDLMIVVGGQNSANTRCLAEVCSSMGVETHHVETAAEIEDSWLKGRNLVGVTTGTSTPDQVIQEVMLKLEKIKRSLDAARRV
jgi:4-hydroxy-3-methylbut-2-enyl diphosphate reductase